MAEILPNQPIIFDEELDCHLCPSNLKMLAQYGDISQFQVRLEPCDSDFSIIQNPEFNGSTHWVTSNPVWTVGGGQAVKNIGTAATLTQNIGVSDGTLVRVRFDFDNADESLFINFSLGYPNFINKSGSYEFWITASSVSYISFAAPSSMACTITNLQAVSVNNDFTVGIIDELDNVVASFDNSSGHMSFDDGYMTCDINWELFSIQDGCYRIALIDPCPCSQKGIVALDFTTSTFEWTLSATTATWTIGSGVATYNGDSTAFISLPNVVCQGITYEVTYTLSGMGAGEEFAVVLGTSGIGTVRTTDGTFTDTITATSGGVFRLRGNSTGGVQTFEVTDVSIEAVFADFEISYSNYIQVNEEFSCKTMLINMCNDSDGMGFGFENTGFSPSFRIEGSLTRGSYPSIRDSYEYSDGLKRTTYGRMRVARELGLDLPAHLVDFMANANLIDHFYVNGDEYFVEDDEMPTVAWDEVFHEGGFTMNISKKTQLLENRRLSNVSVGCAPDGVIIGTFDGDGLGTGDGDGIGLSG